MLPRQCYPPLIGCWRDTTQVEMSADSNLYWSH